MARCSDCNKFVSYGDIEVDLDNESPEVKPEADSGVEIESVSVTIRLTCGECGTDLKQYEESVDLDVPDGWCTCEDKSKAKWEWESTLEASPTDRMENKDRKGKTIKNPRYMKHFYGAELSGTLKCTVCGQTCEVNQIVEEQASNFEEC